MSVHSCNKLCELDDEFHKIQKYEGESEMWWATPNEMREFLHRKIEKIYNLIRKLDELK